MLLISTLALGQAAAAAAAESTTIRDKAPRRLRGGSVRGTLDEHHPTTAATTTSTITSNNDPLAFIITSPQTPPRLPPTITETSSQNTAAVTTPAPQNVMGLVGVPHHLNNLAVGAGGLAVASASAGSNAQSSAAGTSHESAWDNNSTMRSVGPADWSMEPSVACVNWQRPHHLYYQLGNAFFLLAFLAPHCPFGMLWLRALIVIGCVLMGLYGYMIECQQDIVLWSALSLIVNFIYLVVVLCRLRPVRFEKEIEAVYASVFKPLRVTRSQFKKILSCMRVIRSLKYQEVYAQEKVTKVDSLSLVLSGKLVVSQNQRALHIVFAHQFLDSPEWFGVSTDDYFQVSIMAMEESRVLIWHRDKLKLSIMAEPFLQTVFDHILGRDVVKKLMQVTQVSESIASNGFLPSGGYDDGEDKPMLIMKKTVEPSNFGLTALINRQLQAGDPNSWRLGRIDETDHETAV